MSNEAEMVPETTEDKIAKIRQRFVGDVDKARDTVEKAQAKLQSAENSLHFFDMAMEEQEQALKTVDERLRRALQLRGIDPNTGEVEDNAA